MPMIVKFWGARGSVPVPGSATQIYGGNTPCVEVRTEKSIFICDAGSGIRLLSDDLQKRKASGPIHLFLSHLHSAHIQGLSFFKPLFDEPSRARVYSHPGDLAPLKRMIAEDPLFLPKRHSNQQFTATLVELGDERIANPSAWRPIVDRYAQVSERAKGTQWEGAARRQLDSALANHATAADAAIAEYSARMNQLVKSQKIQEAYEVWRDFPETLRTWEVDRQIEALLVAALPPNFRPAFGPR